MLSLSTFCRYPPHLLWERGEVKHFFYGARLITLLYQRVERPGLDGLIKHKISDQTVQVWLNSCQRGKSYEARPVEIMFDLTSLSQYVEDRTTQIKDKNKCLFNGEI